MFQLYNLLYELVSYNNVENMDIEYKKMIQIQKEQKKATANACPIIITFSDETILPIERFQLENTAYHLNNLRSDIIRWKRDKQSYNYREEEGWEYVNDPKTLPVNNYLLYLLDNMPENITDTYKSGWVRADDQGLGLECKVLLNRRELGDQQGENYWIDKRILGERWRGQFNRNTELDKIVDMPRPEVPK